MALCLLAAASGCVATRFEGIDYRDQELRILADNEGAPAAEAVLQVGIARVNGFEQTEIYRQAMYVPLVSGVNEYTVPIELEPGSYRVYLHLFVGSDRRASVIRDLEV